MVDIIDLTYKLAVSKGFQGAGLDYPVGGKRFPDLFHLSDVIRPGHAVTQAQPGKSVYFGESPEDYNIFFFAQVLQAVRIVFIIDILIICLIQHQYHPRRQITGQQFQIACLHRSPCRIIGIAEEEQVRLLQKAAIQEWKSSAAIKGGSDQTNVLGIWLQGETIRLYANSQLLAEFEDDMFDEGRFGLVIGADQTEGFEVFVDEVAYWILED